VFDQVPFQENEAEKKEGQDHDEDPQDGAFIFHGGLN
jgi:hypothetical protein